MDKGHYDHLVDRCPSGNLSRIRLFLELALETGRTIVPDPYFGDMSDYELSLDLIETGTKAWLEHLTSQII